MAKLTPEIKKYIMKNKEKSHRLLSELVWINFGVKVSHVAIGKFLRKKTEKVETLETLTTEMIDTYARLENEPVKSDIEKVNGYLEYIENQDRYPKTITDFLELLKKNKEHIYSNYFIKRLTKGSKPSRSEFMKFFEFIEDTL